MASFAGRYPPRPAHGCPPARSAITRGGSSRAPRRRADINRRWHNRRWDGDRTVVIFDPITKSFVPAGHLIAIRVRHTATLLSDGRILVTGGTTGSQVSADVELFDPASGTSTLVALMEQPRTDHAAARLPDGNVLIVGGSSSDGGVLQSAEVFNPASGSIALLSSSLQRRRAGATATTTHRGRVLVAGGNDGVRISVRPKGTTRVPDLCPGPHTAERSATRPHRGAVAAQQRRPCGGGTAAGQASRPQTCFCRRFSRIRSRWVSVSS